MVKYELTNDTIQYGNKTLHRIRAVTDIGNITAGTYGGFVESEKNLSHYGRCWVYPNAYVCGNAFVTENATVHDTTQVMNDAVISGNARVSGNAIISGQARIKDDVFVYGNVRISGNAIITHNAVVGKTAIINGNAHIGQHAVILSQTEYAVIEHIGLRSYPVITAYRGYFNDIYIIAGNFSGTIDEFQTLTRKLPCSPKVKRVYKYMIKSIKASITAYKSE